MPRGGPGCGLVRFHHKSKPSARALSPHRVIGNHDLRRLSQHTHSGSFRYLRAGDGQNGNELTERIHPRACGGHTTTTIGNNSGVRLIPAWAGTTTAICEAASTPTVHPRLSEEHYSCRPKTYLAIGSTPHARGTLRLLRGGGDTIYGSSPHRQGTRGRRVCHGRPSRLIPAHAGTTLASSSSRSSTADHPRVHGGHNVLLREAPPVARPIPAHAGTTRIS